jgi:hypothetical protein
MLKPSLFRKTYAWLEKYNQSILMICREFFVPSMVVYDVQVNLKVVGKYRNTYPRMRILRKVSRGFPQEDQK